MLKSFTEDELSIIQAALKFYYEDWNKTKAKEFQTARLDDDELTTVLHLRERFLNALIKTRNND